MGNQGDIIKSMTDQEDAKLRSFREHVEKMRSDSASMTRLNILLSIGFWTGWDAALDWVQKPGAAGEEDGDMQPYTTPPWEGRPPAH